MWWWVIGGLAGLFLVGLAWSLIEDWLEANTTPSSDHAELIKERLSSGNYRVIAGVFDRRGRQTAHETWETDELDDDLKEKFGRRNRIRIEL